MQKVSVLIVGLGPTGMVLANELQKHGVNFVIADKRESISSITRAVNLTPATMALLRYSLGDDIDERVTNTDCINVYWNNEKIAGINYHKMQFPYRNFSYYPQPELERDLCTNINVSSKRELTQIIDIIKTPDHYEVLLQDTITDQQYWLACDYLIGCDGNNSIVREFIGSKNDQEEYGANFILFDVETQSEFTRDSLYYLYDDGYIIIVPIGERKYRMIISSDNLESTQTDCYANTEFLLNYLQTKMQQNAPNIEKILWFTSSGFKHRIAYTARSDNCFLCGDAFHVFSPAGGLNLSTGVQDAINLGWKLAYVINIKADKKLLDSYEYERRIAALCIRDKTKYFTGCLVQSLAETKATLPNKHMLNYRLPYMLSGYDNYSGIRRNLCGSKPIEGFHISEFLSDKEAYRQLCSRVHPTHFNLFLGQSLATEMKKLQHPELSITSTDHLHNDIWTLVRPDGYIAMRGNRDTLDSVISYINLILRWC